MSPSFLSRFNPHSTEHNFGFVVHDDYDVNFREEGDMSYGISNSNSFHVEALFKMSSIESCPRGQTIDESTCRSQGGRKTGRQARLSQILDRASQKWTSSFHESPVPSWTPRCTTTGMFLSQVWKRGWSVKGVSSPDDVMAVEVPKYGTFKISGA